MQAQEHERASIAKAIHDDVCQQLTGLTLRLHGLSREPGGATLDMRTRLEELCAQFWSLEREIVALSDPPVSPALAAGARGGVPRVL
jgi:hypothetical protein